MMNPRSGSEAGDQFVQWSLRDLLTIIFKRRALILVFLFTALAVAALIALRTPKTYRVSATLMVNEARAEVPMAPGESQGMTINRVSEEDLNSEIEILKSRQLIEYVVETIWVDPPETEESIETSRMDRGVGWLKSLLSGEKLSGFNSLVVHLQSAIEIKVIPKSKLITIAYWSQDPQWATQVVGTLTDRYLETRADRFQSPQAVAFFEAQMLQAQRRVVENKEALQRFGSEASVTFLEGAGGSESLGAQKQMVMGRLGELESNLVNAEVELDSQRRQVASLREALQREPERLESSSGGDVATEEIERALASLKLQRDALLQDFRPDSRHVRDIDTQIKLAEDRLEERRRTSKFSGTEANPLFTELRGELLRAEAILDGTEARVASLRSQVNEYRKELDILNRNSFDLESLNREARAAEEDYQLYRKKYEEARMSAAMDQEKFINVTVAEPAQMPLKPEPRDFMMKFFLALVIGVLGGVSLAFGVENYVDHSFTTAADLEKRLGIPHLASIPDSARVR